MTDGWYRRQFAVAFRVDSRGAAADVTNNVIDSINDGRDGIVSASYADNSLLIVYEVFSTEWPSDKPYQFDEWGVLQESDGDGS